MSPLLDRQFTWSNHQEHPILVKLDRFLVSTEWSLLLPNSTVSSTSAPVSDHCPITLSARTTIPQPAIFRFDNHWMRVPDCKAITASAWASVQGSPGVPRLARCLKRCRADLKAWKKSRRSPKDVLLNCNLVISMMDLLEEVRPMYHAEFVLRDLVRSAAVEQAAQLAAYWRQRSKVKTCVLGDENTKFFHLTASVHWRRNQIARLQMDDGTVATAHDAKADILYSFYRSLLGSQDACSVLPDLHSYFVGTSLTTSQAAALVIPFSSTEPKAILTSMRKDSAPGPDGFTPLFFQANWELVQADLLALLQQFHESTADLKRINKAYLALLPKKLGSILPKDFRPISLQNCSTKICTKAMTTRLHPYITSLVHSDQTGFIKGRCIAENVLYAAEIVQCCHKRKAPAIVLKLDFRKAL